jgi:formylglycine-generating enzyme required for sulfatase activity
MIYSVIYCFSFFFLPVKTNEIDGEKRIRNGHLKNTEGYEFEMIKVGGGTFQMGNNAGKNDEKPTHSVTVDSFQIGKYEVTQTEWMAVMGTNPSYFKCPSCPVEMVTWDEIQVFIQKINAKTGKKYRLPTESEWEFAARGGNRSKGYQYSGSNNIDSVAWVRKNASQKTHPVGQKQPNELGIYDMSGNVWEFCSDWFKGYPESKEVTDYTGKARVIRGGAWGNVPKNCTNTFRYDYFDLTKRNAGVGFRLVL